jgi:hypothetical protein
MAALSFAADIRPLFRSYDIESMKLAGIDLSSYEDVKKKLSPYTHDFLQKICRGTGRGAISLCKNSRSGWRAG